VPKKWRRRLGPDPLARQPKGRLTASTRLRRLLMAWWPWALISVWGTATQHWGWGIGAGLAGLVTYLITPVEFPPRFGLDHEFAVDSAEFLQTIAGATGVPFTSGNRLDLLNNGNAFYPAMLAAIDAAEVSITIEAYIYWAGDIGQRFAAALAARARDGVRVKILLDAVGSASIGGDILQTLEGGGCQLAWYNRIRWWTIGRFNHRTHRKTLIIDGQVGFTGGAGIADHWMGNAEGPDHWRDMQVRIEGPAVVPLQTGFATNWLQSTGELISGSEFYPEQSEVGTVSVQTLMSSPETGASTVRTMYYLSIVCARRSIHIANPYFVPDEAAIDTLIEARARGVDVRVIVSGRRNDNWLARQNSVRLSGRLLAAGIVILEYNDTMLHHKTMVVDGAWVTIGTTNFDNRSFAHNEESNICVYDTELAAQLEETFTADEHRCERLTLERWNRRGLWIRVQGLVASLLQDQV
jgi:cardiolipin synthase